MYSRVKSEDEVCTSKGTTLCIRELSVVCLLYVSVCPVRVGVVESCTE